MAKFRVLGLLDYDRVEYRPGDSVEIDDEVISARLVRDGVIAPARPRRGSEPKEPPEGLSEVAAAIEELDPEDTSLWTAGGAPTVDALERVLGRDVSGAERDRAWAAVQETRAAGPRT